MCEVQDNITPGGEDPRRTSPTGPSAVWSSAPSPAALSAGHIGICITLAFAAAGLGADGR